MSFFTAYTPFEELGGQLYFHRAKRGPTYEVTMDEQTAIARAMKTLRLQMIMIILGFLLVFVFTILLLPIILDLNPDFAFIVVAIMLGVGVLPFLLMVKLHLVHQKKIRNILGDRRAVDPAALLEKEASAAASPAATSTEPQTTLQTRGMGTGKLAAIFLLGVAIMAVGGVMLFSGEQMEFRRQIIWWLNLFTGGLLTALGVYGLIIRQKPPLSPLPSPRDDQNDQS